jgi:hypothetical protein
VTPIPCFEHALRPDLPIDQHELQENAFNAGAGSAMAHHNISPRARGVKEPSAYYLSQKKHSMTLLHAYLSLTCAKKMSEVILPLVTAGVQPSWTHTIQRYELPEAPHRQL